MNKVAFYNVKKAKIDLLQLLPHPFHRSGFIEHLYELLLDVTYIWDLSKSSQATIIRGLVGMSRKIAIDRSITRKNEISRTTRVLNPLNLMNSPLAIRYDMQIPIMLI